LLSIPALSIVIKPSVKTPSTSDKMSLIGFAISVSLGATLAAFKNRSDEPTTWVQKIGGFEELQTTRRPSLAHSQD
jgi:hypothetical protein